MPVQDAAHSNIIGTTRTAQKHIDAGDISQFADLTGDQNPLHTDDNYASETRFDEPIVHGVFLEGIISAAVAELPKTVILLSKETTFLEPVQQNSTVETTVEVVEQIDSDIFRCDIRLDREDGETAIRGSAIVMLEE
jgi:3-hydroxybutyryl-CoA dehydratase